MVKQKWIFTIMLCLLIAGAARAGDPNEPNKDEEAICLWVVGGSPAYQNTNIGVMLGYLKDDVEIGGAVDWRMYSEGDTLPDDQSDLALGFYGAIHFPEIIDVNNPFEVSFLPEKLASKPCFGVKYLFDLDGKGTAVTPFVGLRIFDLFALIYEVDTYHGIDADTEGKLAISLQYKF